MIAERWCVASFHRHAHSDSVNDRFLFYFTKRSGLNRLQFLVYGIATGTATRVGSNTARVDKIWGVLGNRIRSSAS